MWLAIGWLGLVGVMSALTNWAAIAAPLLGYRPTSMIPPIGALSLAVALVAVPTNLIGRTIVWGALFDPWLAVSALWLVTRAVGRRPR
jgi:hypothetical protein